MSKGSLLSLLALLIAAIVIVAGLMYFFDIDLNDIDTWLKEFSGRIGLADLFGGPGGGGAAPPATDAEGTPLPENGMLTVTVLDCGNADSLFIRTAEGKTMLIDAGESDDYDTINSYLQAAGVSRLDVVVATHPHNDHIGSMAKIIEQYETGAVYMPRAAHNTKTYENLCRTILDKNMHAIEAKGGSGQTIPLGEEVEVTVLGPLHSDYDDLNNHSVVLRLEYGKTVFLFTGDIEKAAEKELVKKYPHLLQCDVLKVPHHGSDTSSSEKFIAAASPRYAAITCDKENDYGHPADEVIERLAEYGATYYRSDANGTVAFYSDGDTVRVKTEK